MLGGLACLVAVTVPVSAANFKRVACPDGKHTATHAAVSLLLTNVRSRGLMAEIVLFVLCVEG